MVIDTCVVIAALRAEHGVASQVEQWGRLVVPAIVEAELWYGALNGRRPAAELARIEDFLSGCEVAPFDSVMARRSAEVKHALQLKGKPMPEADILVAATALALGLPLLTFDAHFEYVEGLRLISP